MTLDEIQKQYDAALMPTYGRFPVALASGHGATAIDVEGRAYIDFGSGIGVNALGYCDEGWVRAVQEQAAALQHISNLYYSPVQVQFAAELCAATGMGRVFLCNSGAEANECAIKLARKYSFDHYGKGRDVVITLVNSFHGRTIATLTATGQEVFHNYFGPFNEGFVYTTAGDIEGLRELVDRHTCAIMLELIQGEGAEVEIILGNNAQDILPYAKDYLRVILIGAPWMTASLVLNNQLRFQGNAIYGTIGIASGAVLNIGLDPLLIFVFDLGVAGAAWATILSVCCWRAAPGAPPFTSTSPASS